MAKKKITGSDYRRKHGLKAINVLMEPAEHALLNRAAGTLIGRRRSVNQFVREAAVAAAHARLEEYEREKNSEKSPDPT